MKSGTGSPDSSGTLRKGEAVVTQPGTSAPVELPGELYAGIDFVNREQRTGRCFVRDDGTTLTVTLGSRPRAACRRPAWFAAFDWPARLAVAV